MRYPVRHTKRNLYSAEGNTHNHEFRAEAGTRFAANHTPGKVVSSSMETVKDMGRSIVKCQATNTSS